MPVRSEMSVCYGGMFKGGYSAEGYGKWAYGGLSEGLNCIMSFEKTDGFGCPFFYMVDCMKFCAKFGIACG